MGAWRTNELVNMLEDRRSINVINVSKRRMMQRRNLQYFIDKEDHQIVRLRKTFFSRSAKTSSEWFQRPKKSTSLTLVAHARASMTTLQRHGGSKSLSFRKGYLTDSILYSVNISVKSTNSKQCSSSFVSGINCFSRKLKTVICF